MDSVEYSRFRKREVIEAISQYDSTLVRFSLET